MSLNIAYSKCLQGNIIEALEYLKSIESRNSNIIEFENKLIKRFISQDEIFEIDSEDPWINDIINSYFEYFKSVLLNSSVKQSEQELVSSLSSIIGVNKTNINEIELLLKTLFENKGYSFLGGITSPYYGPYIWKNSMKKSFNVVLPEVEQEVTVYLISDFLMLSWAHYATIGNRFTGGWAKEDGLYYVNNSNYIVNTESDDFQIRFLKHEAQHLSDYKNYQNLDGINLEYRAKLIELIYYPDTDSLMEKFICQSKNDRSLPHQYASYSIIKALSKKIYNQEFVEDISKWTNINIISEEAYRLYIDNNEKLKLQGEYTVGVI